jgi:hypothetical protein
MDHVEVAGSYFIEQKLMFLYICIPCHYVPICLFVIMCDLVVNSAYVVLT